MSNDPRPVTDLGTGRAIPRYRMISESKVLAVEDAPTYDLTRGFICSADELWVKWADVQPVLDALRQDVFDTQQESNRLANELEAAEAARDQLQQERDNARQALEDDAADFWKLSNAIKNIVRQRSWVTDSRGSYEWDDDRYRDETRHAFAEVLMLIEQAQPQASRRFYEIMRDVPSKPEMAGLKAQVAQQAARIAELENELSTRS